MPRGRLIVVEGLDRSGKSTQCARLLSRLSSTPTTTHHHTGTNSSLPAPSAAAVGQKFPDRSTVIGGMINAYLTSQADLDDRAIHLLFSANRWECTPGILQHLASGTHVICDRYVYSGIAFSAVKGLDRDWCRSCDVGLPRPDLVLFLDVSEEVAAQRGGYGEERYERAETQRLVRQEFMHLYKQEERVIVVDAGKDIDSVEQEIWSHVEKTLVSSRDDDDSIDKIT